MTKRNARQIAKETGESLTEAIGGALKERLQRLRQRRKVHVKTAGIQEVLRRLDRMPRLDKRSADEILGYDKNGLPR